MVRSGHDEIATAISHGPGARGTSPVIDGGVAVRRRLLARPCMLALGGRVTYGARDTPALLAETRMRLHTALAALLLFADAGASFAANTPATTPVQAASHLAAHKALYALTLDKVRGNEIVGVRGTMGYEVTDSCDGWAVRQRLQMTITNADGQDIQTVSDYATWESKD